MIFVYDLHHYWIQNQINSIHYHPSAWCLVDPSVATLLFLPGMESLGAAKNFLVTEAQHSLTVTCSAPSAPGVESLLGDAKNFQVTEAQHSLTVTPSTRSDSVVPHSAEPSQQGASVKPPTPTRFKFLSSKLSALQETSNVPSTTEETCQAQQN